MNAISMNRLYRLLKIDLLKSKKTILITVATLVVILALLPFHVTGGTGTYFFLLYIGGFIVTGYAFSEMHDRRKSFQYLTLPCSNAERFLAKWLLTAVIYALGVLLLYFLFSCLSVGINLLLFHRTISVFNLTQPALWIGLGKYIILQSIVLLGAAYFKKNVLLKTALSIGCLLIVVATLMLLIAWVFCPSCFFGGAFDLISLSLHGAYFLFWIVLAPLCWFVTYLRISDCEIK